VASPSADFRITLKVHNRKPDFTNQMLNTIRFFACFEGCFEKKRLHRLIEKYWREWLGRLPKYQTFVLPKFRAAKILFRL